MSFKKLEGHNSLFSSKVVSAEQFALAQEIIKANGSPIVTRKNLKSFHLELRNKKASPYFIAKNVALKVKNAIGKYDLSRLRVATAKATANDVAESNDTENSATKKKIVRAKKTRVSIAAATLSDTQALSSDAVSDTSSDAALELLNS